MQLRSLILFAFLAFPAAAHGQAAISAGIAYPIAPDGFTSAYNPGFSMSGSFVLPFPEMIVIPRLSAGFAAIQFDEGSDETERGDLSAIFVGFDAQFIRPRGMIKPYIAPFLGFSIVSVEGFSVGETGYTIGGAAGVAVRLPAGPHLFADVRLLHAYLEGGNLTWIPVHVGIAFDLE